MSLLPIGTNRTGQTDDLMVRLLPEILSDSVPVVDDIARDVVRLDYSQEEIGCQAENPLDLTLQNAQETQRLFTSSAKPPEPCQVCGLPAGRHLHYGARVCGSCRGFFRRSVTSKNHHKFKCLRGKDCLINSKSRTSCTWCRYDKCLKAGMRPAWITPVEECKKKSKKEKTEKAEPKKPASSKVPSVARPFSLDLTREEERLIDKIMHECKCNFFNAWADSLSRDASPILQVHDLILLGRNVRPAFINLFEHSSRIMFESVGLKLDDMVEIHPDDKNILIASNFGLFFTAITSAYFHPLDFSKLIDEFFVYTNARAKKEDIYQMIQGVIEQIRREGKQLHFKYDQVYVSPWLSSSSAELRHKECLERIQRWPRHNAENAYDGIMSVLMLCQLMFSTLGVLGLKNRRTVERAQQKYIMLLYRYLRMKYKSQGVKRLGEGLMIASLAQEAYDIHSRRLPV